MTLPVSRHSYASYYSKPAPADPSDASPVAHLTAKRRAALECYTRLHDVELPAGRWEFSSDLPVGKGMSSSTADILALIRCLDSLFDHKDDPDTTRRILTAIERSDAIHADRYTLYLSGAHVFVRDYPSTVAFNVCYAYDEHEVRTEDYPETDLLHVYQDSARDYADSLRRLDEALTDQDGLAMAREATRSAELAQRYLRSDLVADLLRDYWDLGGVGVIRAHTGTVVGLLSTADFDATTRADLCRYFLLRGYRCYFTRAGYPLV
ncbi:hypothetical protein [Streptomyces humi]|uniref:GHMP family kinase ATP-binding protein n=1 Tax=Streptomyces humi TaxID=1428620 RepID=UPI0006287AD7|nr:hypothetical protein [Streptomyces humi]